MLGSPTFAVFLVSTFISKPIPLEKYASNLKSMSEDKLFQLALLAESKGLYMKGAGLEDFLEGFKEEETVDEADDVAITWQQFRVIHNQRWPGGSITAHSDAWKHYKLTGEWISAGVPEPTYHTGPKIRAKKSDASKPKRVYA